MEESISFAQKYLSDILSFFGLNVDVKATHEDDVITLSVPSSHLNGFLIGYNGETLRAMQSIVSSALRSQQTEYFRVNVDVADYKKQKNEKLAEQATEWIKTVISTKETKSLKPMNASDRRVIHQQVGEYPEVTSESAGEGRDRHIQIKYTVLEPTTE